LKIAGRVAFFTISSDYQPPPPKLQHIRVECFIDFLVFVTTPCEATISGTYTINPDGSGTDSIAFTTSSPGCASGTYTQALAIAQRGELVLLSNTNGDQINEEWHLQR